jgi:predicted O-linked N-acetylglucosamine transferase (SPINDLY family)
MQQQPVDVSAENQLIASLLQKAVTRQMPVVELFGQAVALKANNQAQLAVELYKVWIAHNSDHELLHAAFFNYGVAMADVGDYNGAINAYRDAIRVKPDFEPPHINLGRALEDLGQIAPAVSEWQKLIAKLSGVNGDSVYHKLSAYHQLARVLEGNSIDATAEEALRQSLDIDRHQSQAMQHWISLRQRQCKWPVLQESDRVKRKDMLSSISTLSLATLADDPMFQLAMNYDYARTTIGIPKIARTNHATPRRDPLRLRIGYVSSDLRAHAVGFAMTDVMERHDHKNFEILAYYCGIKHVDSTQQRIQSAVDRWTDINGMSDDDAAAKIAADGVDILIDLNGNTKDARTKVFARRPAPIIVNWFGYPSTMGTPYHNYLIADEYLVPQQDEIYYSEKVLRLPCYQPNDRKRVISPSRPTRAQAGLPDNAFVFCSLNGMQKLNAETFDRWMTILGRTPQSVLWLLSGIAETNDRLRNLAMQRGINPQRIVFAEKKPNPDHLARYPLADLFLDNFPYGAHTTAADSMWMGVPILTFSGRSFASRVCGSVVRAAGIGEMVCDTPEQYVERAIEFGNDRSKLEPIKAKLIAGRDTCLLFDTPKLVAHLEDLYRQMWTDLIRGATPVPNLKNLDIYRDIGIELDMENMNNLSNEAYQALYQEKLAAWNAVYPIEPDLRLWRDHGPRVEKLSSKRAVA